MTDYDSPLGAMRAAAFVLLVDAAVIVAGLGWLIAEVAR